MATLYYRPYTSEPITDGDLPAENAVQSVLPEFDYIFPAGGRNAPQGSRRSQPHQRTHLPPEASAELGELERYKDAMRKMGQDILALRDRVRELEQENSALKRDVGQFRDTSQLLAGDGTEIADLSKADLIARYAAMKNKLVSTASQAGQYREKVQQLQNELIRQGQGGGGGGGDGAVGPAHAAQQRLIQQLQEKAEKVKRLEGACEKQEQVIERMERLLQAPRGGGKSDDTLAKALTEENRRLREELAQLRDGDGGRADAGMDDAERLELYQLLDRAETRIASLEKQVAERSREWARERDRLSDRLEALRGKPAGGHRSRAREDLTGDDRDGGGAKATAGAASRRTHKRL